MLTEASWPRSPYINVFATLGAVCSRCYIVFDLYLILSFDHLVRELQLLTLSILTFVFAIGIPGYNFVGWWHTMMNRFHFFWPGTVC